MGIVISIHKALAGLDQVYHPDTPLSHLFQSTRPSRASTVRNLHKIAAKEISIHKALAGLDYFGAEDSTYTRISIHKALAGLDPAQVWMPVPVLHFNPQGPRGPRPGLSGIVNIIREFQSTRPSRASTIFFPFGVWYNKDFNPQGPRGPRPFRVGPVQLGR